MLVPVLRSGLAMLETVGSLFPDARVGFVGLERDEQTAIARGYYQKLPRDLQGSQVMILEPMLATGARPWPRWRSCVGPGRRTSPGVRGRLPPKGWPPCRGGSRRRRSTPP